MKYDELEHSPLSNEPEPERSLATRKIVAIAVTLALIVAAGIWYFRSSGKDSAPAPVQTSQTESPETRTPDRPEPEEQPLVLPDLDASDDLFRDLAGGVSSHPDLVAWLATDRLIRRFVAAVDNVAEGVSPRSHLETMAPKGVFQARSSGGLTTMDPASYRRYNAFAAAVSGLDAKKTVQLYRKLEPLMDEAYRDLGYPSGRFVVTLRSAMNRLLDTPVPTQPVELVPRVSSFEFEDPALESLSPAQKHLIRMGPQNQRSIQTKLREIREELGPEPL